jgi:hypothetical protein
MTGLNDLQKTADIVLYTIWNQNNGTAIFTDVSFSIDKAFTLITPTAKYTDAKIRRACVSGPKANSIPVDLDISIP